MSRVLRAGALLASLTLGGLEARAATPAPGANPALPPSSSCPDGARGRWIARVVPSLDACEVRVAHQRADRRDGSELVVRRADVGRGVTVTVEPDGRGGAWVAWTEIDYMNTSTDVRAAHVDAHGKLVSGGDAALASFLDLFDGVALLPDADGGAYVAWREADASHERHMRLNRLGPDGRVVAGWPEKGIALAASSGTVKPHLVADGQGGAILVADSDPNRTGGEPFAMRVSGDATLMR